MVFNVIEEFYVGCDLFLDFVGFGYYVGWYVF